MSTSNEYAQFANPTSILAAMLPTPRIKFLAGGLLIAGLVFWVYWPALNGGFIWDDEMLVRSNKLVLAPDGLYRMWFTRQPFDYWPVTNSSFWFEWRLWGLDTRGYHVVNVVLQIVNALLIWMILQRLKIPDVFLAALLFAVHPLNVESVAWIAQRKNTLSLCFFLLSMLWYVKSERTVNRWYWFSLAAFVLAMLSKGSVAILPLVFLVLMWWQRGSVTRRDIWQTVPFFVVAIWLTLVNIWFQTHGSSEIIRNVTPIQRLLGAGAVVWFYLYKALLPIDLAFIYPQWKVQPQNVLWWLPLTATIGATLLLWWQRKRSWVQPLFVAWLLFCLGLLPVMGFVDVGFMKHSLVADHYVYTSLIVVATMVAAAWNVVCRKTSEAGRFICWGVAALVILGCCLATRQLSSTYADSLTLYEAALSKNPDSALLQNSFGMQLFLKGEVRDALKFFQTAVNLQPKNAEAINNLGLALANLDRVNEAVEIYRRVLDLRPDFPEAHNNLGLALKKLEQTDKAIAEFQEAVRLNSFYPQAYYNLANALQETGQLSQALDNYRLAVQYDPDYYDAHSALAAALMKSGQPAEAVDHYQQGLRLKPDSPEDENNLASALIQIGQSRQAIEHLQRALQLHSNYAAAEHNLGLALANNGDLEQAVPHYQTALRLKPNFPAAENNLGAALRELGQPQQALVHFQEAVKQNPEYCQAYANMALAYAQLNQPTSAIAAAQKGLEIAQSHGQTELAKQIESWLANYRSQLEPH